MTQQLFCRDFVRSCGATYPDKIAYIDAERRRTWDEMQGRSLRLAASLCKLGVRKGDVVAILAFDHVEVVEHLFACMHIGAIRVSVNRGYSTREMVHVIRDCDAKVIVVQESCQSFIAPCLTELRREGRQFVGFGAGHGFENDYETLLAHAQAQVELPALEDSDPLAISYTSGTTGLPKGVIMTQGGVRQMLLHLVIAVGFRHEDIWLNPTSMSWATFMMNIMSIVNGMTTVLPGAGFQGDTFLRLCSENKVTAVVLVPVMLQRVIDRYQAEKGSYDLSALRMICYGSAPAPVELVRSAISTFRVELTQLYGLTEFCAWATFLRHEDHLKALNGQPDLLRSCGKPGVFCEVSIRDANGVPVERGKKGELWMRSETLMKGYRNLPELTRDVLSDGWLKSHDIGWQDEQGYIYLTDRKHFLIITGAANVFPSIVESTLAAHAAVREVAVVGAPHPEWGEAVVAMVSLKAGAAVTAEDLIEHCRGKVAKWEVPKFVEIVDELPKGPTLKILKNAIRARYADGSVPLPWNAERKTQQIC